MALPVPPIVASPRRVVPPAICKVADAVDSTVGTRLRRSAEATSHGFVADPAHVEFLPERRGRRYVAAWKIVAHDGVVVRADVHTDDEGRTVVGRVDGRVIGVASTYQDIPELLQRIDSALDDLAICA